MTVAGRITASTASDSLQILGNAIRDGIGPEFAGLRPLAEHPPIEIVGMAEFLSS